MTEGFKEQAHLLLDFGEDLRVLEEEEFLRWMVSPCSNCNIAQFSLPLRRP